MTLRSNTFGVSMLCEVFFRAFFQASSHLILNVSP